MLHGRHRIQLAPIGIERDKLGEMPREVTVEDPVAGPGGLPGNGHRLTRQQELSHRQPLRRRRVQRVADSVTLGIGAEVEAVQVHRMGQDAQVEDAPVRAVALYHVEPLGVGP